MNNNIKWNAIQHYDATGAYEPHSADEYLDSSNDSALLRVEFTKKTDCT